MPTEVKHADDEMAVQEHCIDLPGETVQCWLGGGTDKLKVILRKHRDVIFDIKLGNGKTYTLETTESDFYNPRDKKLVYAARRDKVTFKDGERMHVWVSRGFRGALVLKCDGHVISEVKPNEWDTHRHTEDPKEKPAPIIIALAHSPAAPTAPESHSQSRHGSMDDSAHSLHVHEVSPRGAPQYILEFFESGAESLHVDSEDIVTRNWIIGQLAGVGGYALDNHAWVKELVGCRFHLQRVVHRAGPKVYMIFNGNNRIREVVSASRYGLSHPKIVKITGGAGGATQAWDAAKGAAKDSIKVFAKEEGKMVLKGGAITIGFTIAIDVAEWYKDYSQIGADGKPKKDFVDLFAKVGIDLMKAGLVAALTTATVAALFSGLALIGVSIAAPVVLVVLGTLAVAAAWTYAVEKGDKAISRALGEADSTTWCSKTFRDTARYLAEVSKDVRYQRYELVPVLPIMR
ncbi:hypothetical protein NX773_10680 [Massilia solisilvae]|uniref:Uncharacterized protein n=1 Tax=Massilia solisilvae TaxID=1811225 RepID=A0ABT2BL80_9BURK|nr:hypothetical protein [Massilia solisilvae]MCS0608628.1 hypothetical protein [Massilia solisilvae]